MGESMGPDSFLTLAQPATGLYKSKGSKFIALAYPVRNVEEVQTILQTCRKTYYDARHCCYAYRLGADQRCFRANDDGEPSGTAGRPILGQIQSKGLTNVLVVVVRYFGGILLGTGGLVVAYKTAACDALQNATLVEQEVVVPTVLAFPYAQFNEVMRLIKETDTRIVRQSYEESPAPCYQLECEIKQRYVSRFTPYTRSV